MVKTVPNKHILFRWDTCKTGCPTGRQVGGARVRREARLRDFDKCVASSHRICCPFPILGCTCRLSAARDSTSAWESRQTGRQRLTNFLCCKSLARSKMKTRGDHKNHRSQEGWIQSRIRLRKQRVEWKDIKVLHRRGEWTIHPPCRQQAGGEGKPAEGEENFNDWKG